MNPRPPSCAGCPAHESGHAVGFVPPTAAPCGEARWIVLGQGPGQQEAHFGEPFWPSAPSGRMLRDWLTEAGIDLRTVAFGNVVQCWLPATRMNGDLGKGSRPPTADEVRHCWRAHVGPWLHRTPHAAHILTVGAPATRFLLGLAPSAPAENLAGLTSRRALPPLQPEEPAP